MVEIIEQSNLAFEQRNRSQLEISAIDQANRREQEAFGQQMAHLAKILGTELQVAVAGGTDQSKKSSVNGFCVSENNREADRKQALEQAKVQENLKCSQQRREQVQHFEEAFRKIAAATGINDVDELVSRFIANEEQNFSLFVYANEQADEIEKLEAQIQELLKEQSRYAQESGDDANQYEDIVKKLDDRLTSIHAQITTVEAKCDENEKSADAVKDGIKVRCRGSSSYTV